jgi:ComF family protein
VDHSCILCGQTADLPVELCTPCKKSLLGDVNRCVRCGLELSFGEKTCGKCLNRAPVFDRCESVLGYTLEAGQLIRQLKYNQKTSVAHVMAYLLAEYLQSHREILPEVIIPMPIHRNRLYRRGFNQTMEIAKYLGIILDIPVDYKCCQRTKQVESQTNLTVFGRRNNIKGVFRMIKDVDYKHVAILDDVVTTGATVDELTRVLKSAGIKTVEVWCCVRTEEHQMA